MRKYTLLLLASTLFFSACTKNYKSIEEYNTAMKTVRSGHESISLELKQTTTQYYIGEITYKTIHKGEKWKSQQLLNGCTSSTTIYDGNNVMQLVPNHSVAAIIPFKDSAQQSAPTYDLFSWYEKKPFIEYNSKDCTNTKMNYKKTIKNGYWCRLFKLNENEEICVSDKYGFAVYKKIKHKSGGEKIHETTIEVTNIDTTPISDTEFKLPNEVKKINLNNLTKQMKRALLKYPCL